MNFPSPNIEATIREQLLGRRLSGVSFILEYIQLQFDPPPIVNALTPVSVRSGVRSAASGDESFRNVLCEQITKTVTAVVLQEGEALTLRFADGSEIALSLRPADYVCPEAVNVYGKDHLCIVI